jgi:hypothetical protein
MPNSGTGFLNTLLLRDSSQTEGNYWRKMYTNGRIWEAENQLDGVQRGVREKKGCFEGTKKEVVLL